MTTTANPNAASGVEPMSPLSAWVIDNAAFGTLSAKTFDAALDAERNSDPKAA